MLRQYRQLRAADSAARAPSCVHLCSPLDVATSKGRTSLNPLCRSYGTLVGEPVILVATGIGPGAAIICLAEVRAHPPVHIVASTY